MSKTINKKWIKIRERQRKLNLEEKTDELTKRITQKGYLNVKNEINKIEKKLEKKARSFESYFDVIKGSIICFHCGKKLGEWTECYDHYNHIKNSCKWFKRAYRIDIKILEKLKTTEKKFRNFFKISEKTQEKLEDFFFLEKDYPFDMDNGEYAKDYIMIKKGEKQN